MDLIIISGRSGVGKSVALSVLEDLGYYCLDNIPINMLRLILEEISKTYKKVVIGLDIRNLSNGQEDLATNEIKTLKALYNTYILFFTCQNQILINRYADTRRTHPLMINDRLTLEQALDLENESLNFIQEMADFVIDTTYTNIHQLNYRITEWLKLVGEVSDTSKPKLIFSSFGFKRGSPPSSNFVFDVRHLPNPYWDKKLALQTGLDRDCEIFFESHQESQEELDRIIVFLTGWLNEVTSKSTRKLVTISIGCTGGQHRSVYVANKLAQYFSTQGYSTQANHFSLDVIHTY